MDRRTRHPRSLLPFHTHKQFEKRQSADHTSHESPQLCSLAPPVPSITPNPRLSPLGLNSETPLFPPSHFLTHWALHWHTLTYPNPSAWSIFHPSFATQSQNYLLQGACPDPPLKVNSPGLSLSLTYPFLSLHIGYFCMSPQILAAVRWKICKRDLGGGGVHCL